MQVIEAKFYETHPGQFSISVLGQHAYRFWRENLYSFQYEDGKVFFLMGSTKDGKNKKFAGEAESQTEAIEAGTKYLESWLKECRALGELYNEYRHLLITRDDARGAGYFTVRVSARYRNQKEKPRTDISFRFLLDNKDLYYLGDDKEARMDLVRFVYRGWHDRNYEQPAERVLNVAPKDQTEAVRDAIDYLEWLLTEQGRI